MLSCYADRYMIFAMANENPPPNGAEFINRFAGRFPVHAMRRRRSVDGAYSYDYVSPTVAQTFGLDTDLLLAATNVSHDWVYVEDRPRFIEALERSAATLEMLDEEVRVIRPDGAVRWVRSLGEPRREPDGGTIWDGVALDVTDRREALALVLRAMDMARDAELTASRSISFAPQPLLEDARSSLAALQAAVERKDLVGVLAATQRLRATLTPLLGEDAPEQGEVSELTRRQQEVAALISEGLSNAEIAARLRLSTGTVKIHVSRILARLGARNRTDLSRKFLRQSS